MSSGQKRWLLRLVNIAGAGLAVWATVLVVQNLVDYMGQIETSGFGPLFWLGMVLLGVVYGFISILLARAWWQTLRALGVESSFRISLRIYGVSQMGKYIPGNVAQVIGRQAMAQAAGYDGLAVGKSAIVEVLLLCAGAFAFAMVAAPVIFPDWPMLAGIVLFAVVSLMLWYLLGSVWNFSMQRAFGLLIAFLFLAAAVFCGLLTLSQPIPLSLLPLVIGAYTAAWLIGYVAPGAPAGIGIREVALTWLLGEWFSASVLTLVVVLGRLVTTLGDLFFVVIAYSYGRAPVVEPSVGEVVD